MRLSELPRPRNLLSRHGVVCYLRFKQSPSLYFYHSDLSRSSFSTMPSIKSIALVGYALCIGETSCDSLDLVLTELNGEASASAHSNQASMKRRMTQPPSEDAAESQIGRASCRERVS